MKKLLGIIIVLLLIFYTTSNVFAGLELIDFDPRPSGFGTVLILKYIKIKNNGNTDIKDFIIQCDTKGKSGTKIDSNITKIIYEIIPAGKTKTFRNINMGFMSSQTNVVVCGVGETK